MARRTKFSPGSPARSTDDASQREARAEYRRRLYNVAIAMTGGIGALMVSAGTSEIIAMGVEKYFRLDARAFPVAGLILLLMSMSVAVVQYLQIGTWGIQRVPEHREAPTSENAPAERLDQPVPHGMEDAPTPPRLSEPTPVEPESPHFADITAYANEMFSRLRDAIEEQGRRNNINLGFGIFITLLGISALLYFVREYKDIDPLKPWSMLNVLPRLSLVVLIELFAYFFLNLYRNGLADVKYLQNELVNIRMRTLGLRTAVREDDKETAAYIMKAFADTDRNVVAKKSDGARQTSDEVLKTAQQALKIAEKVAGGGDK